MEDKGGGNMGSNMKTGSWSLDNKCQTQYAKLWLLKLWTGRQERRQYGLKHEGRSFEPGQ
ncbi:hypothetical protein DXN04_26535 [Chitinophaga silvisoli]|uniref:Uncharacterized protein n=1 Tax=Chitinophaga silvisoli TaxID=2291814 RepID=A0A3E1NVD6_9BACT|nr:hypothetical protein DXN04_26535 [Chitinophaga silvisoli]